jgi:hypothetical protein
MCSNYSLQNTVAGIKEVKKQFDIRYPFFNNKTKLPPCANYSDTMLHTFSCGLKGQHANLMTLLGFGRVLGEHLKSTRSHLDKRRSFYNSGQALLTFSRGPVDFSLHVSYEAERSLRHLILLTPLSTSIT